MFNFYSSLNNQKTYTVSSISDSRLNERGRNILGGSHLSLTRLATGQSFELQRNYHFFV